MRKLLIVIFTCLLFVSCATTKNASNSIENSRYFHTPSLNTSRIEITDNQELRGLFDEFNELYFEGRLIVDNIGYVDGSLLRGKGKTYNYAGYAFWEWHVDACRYGIAMVNNMSIAENYFKGVLLHEMTHLFFFQKGMYHEKHGKNFREMIDMLHEMNPEYEKVYD